MNERKIIPNIYKIAILIHIIRTQRVFTFILYLFIFASYNIHTEHIGALHTRLVVCRNAYGMVGCKISKVCS